MTADYIEVNYPFIKVMSTEKYSKLANSDKEPTYAILNLDWDSGGTHWVGVISKDNIIRYYDPFGVNSPFKNIKKPVIFNQIDDQSITQANCGWRSLMFILSHL